MSEKIEQTELDDALKIARKIRETILFGNNTLESNLHGFLTVAQILGRNNDVEWVKGELLSYGNRTAVLPSYRKNVLAFVTVNKVQIQNKTNSPFWYVSCVTPLTKLEHFMKDEEQNIQFTVVKTDVNYKEIAEQSVNSVNGTINLSFPKSDITKIFAGAKVELIERLNSMIAEITYGKIPSGIFKQFQNRVNQKLIESNPSAVTDLNIAYESLGKSEDPERISNVAFACRRLIKAVVDKLFPAQRDGKYTLKSGHTIDIGEESYLNRLSAFIDSVDSENRKFLEKKLKILRDLYGEIPESIQKGAHLTISNLGAELLVIYTYLILGEIILESK